MTWRTYETEIEVEGRPSRARVKVDDGLLADAPITGVTRRMRVRVHNTLPAGDGYWAPEEEQALADVDGSLLKMTSDLGHGWAVYVLRICTPGIRDYYFHLFEHAHIGALQSLLGETHPSYTFEVTVSDDPGWELYRRYAAPDGGGST